ncbi:MAG: ABC transporter permease [Actinobacteria bacterium]|nr:ABC transporter permease [Actinomycetota bacterium]
MLVTFTTINERQWGTWERLRLFTGSSIELMAGKIVSPVLISLGQFTLLFLLANLLFDFNVESPGVLIVVSMALTICIVTMGIMTAAICKTLPQANVLSNLAVVGFGTVGGAFLPLDVLPGWAQGVAPATPAYWAMKGYSAAVLPGAGDVNWEAACGVLLLFSVFFALVAAWRFRV